jgi:hypothetical protein
MCQFDGQTTSLIFIVSDFVTVRFIYSLGVGSSPLEPSRRLTGCRSALCQDRPRPSLFAHARNPVPVILSVYRRNKIEILSGLREFESRLTPGVSISSGKSVLAVTGCHIGFEQIALCPFLIVVKDVAVGRNFRGRKKSATGTRNRFDCQPPQWPAKKTKRRLLSR